MGRPPTVSKLYPRLTQLWRDNSSVNEIASILAMKPNAVKGHVVLARKSLGVTLVPYRRMRHRVTADVTTWATIAANSRSWNVPRVRKTVDVSMETWERIAALWAQGWTEADIAVDVKLKPTGLITRARYKLGVAAIPPRQARGFPAKPKVRDPNAPITMSDLNRHYLRRVGSANGAEYIFRTEDGTVEEVWVKTIEPSGIIWRVGRGSKGGGNQVGKPIRLAFKSVMGLTEKRTVV